MLDVCCCEGFTLVAVSRGYSLVVVLGFLVVAATLVHHRLSDKRAPAVSAPGLYSMDSVVVAHGLSCSTACRIFLDQRLNLCLLH